MKRVFGIIIEEGGQNFYVVIVGAVFDIFVIIDVKNVLEILKIGIVVIIDI